MPNGIVRNAPIYAEGKKIAEIESADYDLDSGDEPLHTDAGVVYSNGQITSKVVCNTIVPVSGMTSRLISYLINKQMVRIGIVVDGQMHQIPMRPMRASYKSDTAKGHLKGTFEFNGGAPDVT